MHKHALGRTGLRLSRLALGTWGLAAQSYGPVDDAGFERTIAAALDTGMTTFDMAPLWGDGRAERIVGRTTSSRRDEVQYVTRAGLAAGEEQIEHRYDAESLISDCEASLKRLGTDRIDLWLIHNPPDWFWGRDDWAEVPARLKREGKIRCWGASVSDADQARRAIAEGADALCIVHNLLVGTEVEDLASDIAVAGCGVLARSPLAYGLLSGTWDEDRSFTDDDHRSRRWTSAALRTRIRQVNTLRFLVRDDIADMATAALRFALSHAAVTSALVGARSPEQVEAAAEAVSTETSLSEEDLLKVSQVLAAIGV